MSDKSLVPTTTQESVEAFAKRVMFGGVPRDTLTLTLLMCQRYGLDPLMKHVVVIQFGGKAAPYITRDGLLHVAHRSGQLDGMNVTYGVDDGDMWAECTVWRKDMTHPFIYRVYRSEYDSKRNVWNSHPRAMLAKTAEVFALRRAFDVDMTAIEEMDKAVHEGDGQIIEAEEAVRREAEIDPGKAADQPPTAKSTTPVKPAWVWVEDRPSVEKFFAWAGERGLSRPQTLQALGVEDISAYTGDKAAARDAVNAFNAQPA